MFLSAGCSLLRAEGFFCNFNVFYGGLGIGTGKLQFSIKYVVDKKFPTVIFLKFLVIKILDPDPHSGLDPYPQLEKINADPQPCFLLYISYAYFFANLHTDTSSSSSLVIAQIPVLMV
jgi:hypothetical protein